MNKTHDHYLHKKSINGALNMNIRKINEKDDLKQISTIYEKSWKWAYKGIIPQNFLDKIPEGKWINHLKKSEMTSFVIEENDLLIGTASVCRSRFKCFADMGEIVSIYMLPEFAGRGYGMDTEEDAWH